MRTLWLLLAVAAMGAAQSRPPVLTTLYSFKGRPDGASPAAALVLGRDGELYGTTSVGGTNRCFIGGGGCGTAFRLTPPKLAGGAWEESVLYDFRGRGDGDGPSSTLVPDGHGGFYGTTAEGGSYGCFLSRGCGTIFQLQAPRSAGGAWTEKVLYRFSGSVDGADPFSLVGGSHGVLYGITAYGGSGNCPRSLDGGCGVVFALAPPAAPDGTWTETVLYNFPGGSDGWYPASLVAGSDGALYGSTGLGGDDGCPGSYGSGCGIVFGLIPSPTPGGTWTKVDLHRFTGGDDGADPGALVIGHDAAIYVVTAGGGAAACGQFGTQGCGSIVRLTQAIPYGPWAATMLYGFQGLADGAAPIGLVMGNDGLLYGTASTGGLVGCGASCGTIFRLAPPAGAPGGAWTETTLHEFTGGSDGSHPSAAPILTDNGVLYGTASGGGLCLPYLYCGTVFQLLP